MYVPEDINLCLVPEGPLAGVLLTGIILACLGLIVSPVAIFQLKSSFGFFVQVRAIMTKGLYRHVRHPIYSGQRITDVGFFFIIPRFYNLMLGLALIGIRLYRAVLEENKLIRHSPEYQAYARKIPFMLPLRFKKKIEGML